MPPAAEKHPHAEKPSVKVIREVLKERQPALRDLYVKTHRLILETFPGIQHSLDLTDGMMGYGARQYGYDGWGMLALSCNTRWLTLNFFIGAHLPDPDGILEGTGKNLRHVKLRTAEELEQRTDAIRALLLASPRE